MQQFVNGRLHNMQQLVEAAVVCGTCSREICKLQYKRIYQNRKRSPVFAPNSFFITYFSINLI